MLYILATILSTLVLILWTVTIWKIAYMNGYTHGHNDGTFEEGCRLKKRWGIPITELEEDLSDYI